MQARGDMLMLPPVLGYPCKPGICDVLTGGENVLNWDQLDPVFLWLLSFTC